ncbi:RNA polymerase sigma factor [Chitinophaga eiseniae]|uniref:RNA polymerase sigma factor n=1 Tax=Chitinophaga eiseniae TaxID=634771 RepID=A0A847SSI5_9BACT|nr:RNA polymerase sigma factor [Chitinophaga eiseniae]
MQEVFMKIWQHINKYDPDKGNLLWWTKKIAWNTSLDIIRSKHFSNSRLNEPLSDVHKHLLGDTNQVEFGLRKLTARLKKEHKEVVGLVYFEGYRQEELAGKLGIPLGTVKSRLRAAMKALRKLI